MGGEHIDRLLNQHGEYLRWVRSLFRWMPALVLLLALWRLLYVEPFAENELMKVALELLQQCRHDLEVSAHGLFSLKRDISEHNSRLAEIRAQRDASAADVKQCADSLAEARDMNAEAGTREIK